MPVVCYRWWMRKLSRRSPWLLLLSCALLATWVLDFTLPALAGGLLLLVWALPPRRGGAWHPRKRPSGAQLLARQQKLRDLRVLSWNEFEELVAAVYRRRGWRVELCGTATGGGSDGGVDVVLRRGPKTWLVQCKHWKGRVGVKPLREMIGLLEHHNAERGVIIASGGFTKPAWDFVHGKRLSLVDGKRLLEMVDEKAGRDA